MDMTDFESFVARHGECATQALLDTLERFEGHAENAAISLEERWCRVMKYPAPYQPIS
jgi:hypothetical protein